MNINSFYYYSKPCAYDGCRKDLQYVLIQSVVTLKNRYYCSHKCLCKQYKSLSYQGATHFVHQEFGPEHPVTIQVKKMQKEIIMYRKILDLRGLENKSKTALSEYISKVTTLEGLPNEKIS